MGPGRLESEQTKASQLLLHCGVRLPSRILVPDNDHRWKERTECADSMMGPRQSGAILAPLYPAWLHVQKKSKLYVPHTVLPSPKHHSHYGPPAAHCCYPRTLDTEPPLQPSDGQDNSNELLHACGRATTTESNSRFGGPQS